MKTLTKSILMLVILFVVIGNGKLTASEAAAFQNEKDAVGTIQFQNDIEGAVFIKTKAGKPVTDFEKEFGSVREMAFEAGIYTVVLIFDGERYVIKRLNLKAGELMKLYFADFKRKSRFGKKVKRFFKARQIKRKTLLRGNGKVNFFIESSLKVTDLNDKSQLLVGGTTGILVGERLMIGFGGYGNVSLATRYDDLFDQDVLVGYGGLVVGYNFNPRDLVNIRFSTLIGAGAESKVREDEDHHHYHEDDWCDWHWDIFDYDLYDGHIFFVMEPQLDLFVNLSRHFKLGVTFSYRFINGERSDLDGFSFGCNLQFNI